MHLASVFKTSAETAKGKGCGISSDMKNVQSGVWLVFFPEEKWKRFLVGAGILGNVSIETLPVTLWEARCGCRLESRADKTVSELLLGWMEKSRHLS